MSASGAKPGPKPGPNPGTAPRVAVVMGSQSDWTTLRHAAATLAELGVDHETRIVSAHRTPERLYAFAREAKSRGVRVIVAGAGGAAHLPGMLAALTPLPVLGVPVRSHALSGMDSLLSIVQMPAGIPVATVAVGGAQNAGLLAVRILATADPQLREALDEHRAELTEASRDKDTRIQQRLAGRSGGFGFHAG